MREEMTDVIRLGHATAEEWYKGLEDRGQAKLADSSRWEQWELTGGFQSLTSSSGIRSSLTSGVVRTPGSHATNPDRASNEVYNSSSKVHPLTSMTARIDRPVASPLPQGKPQLITSSLFRGVLIQSCLSAMLTVVSHAFWPTCEASHSGIPLSTWSTTLVASTNTCAQAHSATCPTASYGEKHTRRHRNESEQAC